MEDFPRILVNGGELNVTKECPELYLSELFLLGLEMNLVYWSFKSLKEFYYECTKIVCQFSQERKYFCNKSVKSGFSRFITKAERRFLKRRFDGRESLLEHIYNIILSSENLKPLRGFGFGLKIGNKPSNNLWGNSERVSVLNGRPVSVKEVLKNQREERKKKMAEKVKFGDLKKAVKAFNELEFVEDKIKIVGKKKEDVYETFLSSVEAVVDDHEEELPEEVIEVYNALSSEAEEEEAEETEEEETEEIGAEEEEVEEKEEVVKEKKSVEKKEKETKKIKKEKGPKKEKKESEKRISWIDACTQAILKSKNKKQSVEKAENIFREGGGRATKDVSKWAALNVGRVERVMVLIDFVEIDEKGNYHFK